MGDQTKKELKELGKKYDEMKANLEKRIDNLQERLKDNPDKELRSELDQVKKDLKELQIKIEEMNYIKSGYVLKGGKWVKPEEKKEEPDPPKPPEETDPPKKKEEPEKDSGWLL